MHHKRPQGDPFSGELFRQLMPVQVCLRLLTQVTHLFPSERLLNLRCWGSGPQLQRIIGPRCPMIVGRSPTAAEGTYGTETAALAAGRSKGTLFLGLLETQPWHHPFTSQSQRNCQPKLVSEKTYEKVRHISAPQKYAGFPRFHHDHLVALVSMAAASALAKVLADAPRSSKT